MHRFVPPALAALALVLSACADDRSNAFDPATDRDPPELVAFTVETVGGEVFATWSASEPVHAVVEWGSAPDALHHHSYPVRRGWETGGRVRLLAPESDTTYSWAVRLRDRAGNEAAQFLPGSPTFTTGTVDTEPLPQFVMIDVGWGDALYWEAPDGAGSVRRVLVDAGHPVDAAVVRDFLAREGALQIDVASMSHVHNDHIGGYYGDGFADVPGLFDGGGVTAEYFLDIEEKTPNTTEGPYDSLMEVIPGATQHLLLATGAATGDGAWADWGEGVQVDLLAAGRKDYLDPDYAAGTNLGSVQNNDSMVWRVRYGDFVLLLMGDGEFATEQFLMDTYGPDFLRATVHKLGHHGSNDSNGEKFMRATDPVVALITNSVLENPGVMHPYVLGRLRGLGIDYFASDRAIPNRDRALPGIRGDIRIRTDGQDFTVSAERIRYE
jgi:competence protein ComEC